MLIIGMGGVGTMAAYALETGGKAEVTAVLRSNYNAVENNGFDIHSLEYGEIKGWKPTTSTPPFSPHSIQYPNSQICLVRRTVPNVCDENLEPFDFVLVTTKNILDIPPTVADMIDPAVTVGKTAIVLCQNGLNIEKPLFKSRYGTNPILSSVSLISVAEVSHGKVVHDDKDVQKIGPFTNPAMPTGFGKDAAEWYISLYNARGLLTITYDADVQFTRWRKLVYNASYNTVSTVLRMDTARMRMSKHIIDDLIRPIMLEIIAAAKAVGADLPNDLPDVIIRTDPTVVEIKPSMLQDIEKGNFIELETIAGEALREGEKRGVSMPTLKSVYGILKGLQLKTREVKGLWEPKFSDDNPYK